jgi:hypothetical protein
MSPGGRKGEERRQHFQTYQYKVEAQYLIIFKEANTRQGGDYWISGSYSTTGPLGVISLCGHGDK